MLKTILKILYRLLEKSFYTVSFHIKKLLGNLPAQCIYLTFDDGPLNGTTNCLKICNELGIKATFFLVGKHAESVYGKQVITLLQNNSPHILIANHSYSHANEKYKDFYNNPHKALADFYQAEQNLPVSYKIVRLPGYNTRMRNGILNSVGLVKPVSVLLIEDGFKLIGWDLEWIFKREGTPKKVVDEILYLLLSQKVNIPNHLVLLVHDWMFQKEEQVVLLKELILRLKKYSNICFETVDKYPLK